jgi:hypothetical protein
MHILTIFIIICVISFVLGYFFGRANGRMNLLHRLAENREISTDVYIREMDKELKFLN